MARGKGRRILIVDDDETVRYLCVEALREYETCQAGNGREALGLLAKQPADVILTDVMMPEMNGLELLRKVKEQRPNQIVVVMSSFGRKEIVLQALKSNADDFIDKPIDMLQVRSVVDRALEKQQLREELIHLKQLDKLKSDFLGLVSHKLKTPVTIISLAAQMVMDGLKENVDPRYRKNAKAIEEQTTYLVTLIEELLRFSDIILQEGKPDLKLASPEEIIHSGVDGIREAASLKGVEVEIRVGDQLPQLLLDRQRIQFVVQALLDNAVKFTPQGGSVLVSCTTDGKEVRIGISDTGTGISPEEQAKIFEKFYQIDPDYTGQVRGFGLGLYYARRFVQDQGGSIELESRPEKGTKVTVSFPVTA